MSEKIVDILIVGGGIAGMTAAIYGRRANKSVLILETEVFGGQIQNTQKIENYPGLPHVSGPELSDRIRNQAEEFGTEFEYAEAVSVEKTEREGKAVFVIKTDGEETYIGRSLIWAVGTGYRQMGVAHEKELTGKGISFCATCDGAIYKNRDIAVFGGGNAGLYSALYISDVADKVYLIHHKSTFNADAALVDKVRKKPNVEFLTNTIVSELESKDGKLSGLKVLTGEKELGHSASKDDPGVKMSDLKVDALFVQIGREPKNSLVRDFALQDQQGYIITDGDCRTYQADSTDKKILNENFFCAGDCREKNLRQMITAAADGALAANSAILYLQK